MRPVVINGQSWQVVRDDPGDLSLVDREGRLTLGTADPLSKTIHLSAALVPPMLDRVLLHELAHAVTMAYGKLWALSASVAAGDRIGAEEWAADMVGTHGAEVAALASEVLGRPVMAGFGL